MTLKNVSKRLLSVFLCALVLFSVFDINIKSKAIAGEEVLIGTAGYAILGTALLACGIMITSDAGFQQAVSTAWDRTTDNIKQKIHEIETTAMTIGVGGKLVAHWAKDKWNDFTDWVSDTFTPGETITEGATIEGDYPAQIVNTAPTLPRLGTMYQDKGAFSPNNFPIFDSFGNDALQGDRQMKFTLSSTLGLVCTLVAGGKAIFEASSTKYQTSNANASRAISVFTPEVINGEYRVKVAARSQLVGYPTDWTATDAIRMDFGNSTSVSTTGWQISNTYPVAALRGLPITLSGTTIKVGNMVADGVFLSIAEYMYKSLLMGDVIGLSGADTYVDTKDVYRPSDGQITINSNADYFPNGGVLSPPIDIPADGSIGITIPTTWDDGLGQDVIDLGHIGELAPSDVRVSVDGEVIPKDETQVIPRDIVISDDVTVGDITGTETSDDTANKLRLPRMILRKFPFCIPYDLYNGISSLFADNEAVPKFVIPFKIARFGINHNIVIDFARFQSIATLAKWFLSAIWIIILIMITRRLIFA